MHNFLKPRITAVELAIAALDGNPNPLDMDFSSVGESRSDLDLDDADENGICSKPRRSHPSAETCIICGQPLCDACG